VKIGVVSGFDGRQPPEFIVGAARIVEERKLHSFFVPEHVLFFREYASRYPYSGDGRIPGEPDGTLEPFTALAYIAAHTPREKWDIDLIDEIHRRTTRLKNSAEPMVAFGFQRVVAETPSTVSRHVTDYFAGKTIGQLTNVPGPRVALTMAGAPVRSILGWVPTSGDQPLGVCLFSYDGAVTVGVSTDARMIPDPLLFAELVERHLAELARIDDVATEGPNATFR